MALLHLLLLLLSAAAAAVSAQWQTSEVVPGHVSQLTARIATLRNQIDTAPSPPAAGKAYYELGFSLQQLSQLETNGNEHIPTAIHAYRSALSSLPDPPSQLVVACSLVAFLLESGFTAQALAQLDEAAHLSPPAAPTLCMLLNRAKALAVLGRVEEAAATYDVTLQRAHGRDLDVYSRAAAAVEHADDEQLRRMVRAVKGGRAAQAARAAGLAVPAAVSGWLHDMTDLQLGHLGFGIARAYEQRARLDKAWDALTRANQAMQLVQPYSPEGDQQVLSTLISLFNGRLSSLPLGSTDPTPVFVVGMPRSGSTLVEQMLGSHSEVWGAGEDTAVVPLQRELNAVVERGGPVEEVVEKTRRIGDKYVEAMRRKYAERGAAATGRSEPPRRIVDKMLRNIWLLGSIHIILPKSSVIHVVRHPLDVALSCFQQPFGGSGTAWALDLQHIAVQINMTYQLAQHWDSAYPGRMHMVMYEELVQYPRQVASELLSVVGLPWEEQVLSFHKSQRDVSTASVVQVRKPLYNTSVFKWRQYAPYLGPLRQALGGTVQQYEEALAAALARRRAEGKEGDYRRPRQQTPAF